MAVSVPFHELSGSGQSTHSIATGNTDRRFFLVRWSERYTFASEMAGTSHPSLPYTVCSRIELGPLDPNQVPASVISNPLTQLVNYAQNDGYNCLAVCEYETDQDQARWPCDIPKPSIEVGTALVMRMRLSGQYLRVSGRDMAWSDNTDRSASGHLVQDDSPAARILFPTSEFQIDWLYVDEPPIDEWETEILGKVNSTTFLGSEPETILFEGYDLNPSRQFQVTNPFSFTLSCTFRKRRIVPASGLSSSGTPAGTVYGWNHEYRADGWERVKMFDGAGNAVDRYEQVDMGSMFYEAPCGDSSSSGG